MPSDPPDHASGRPQWDRDRTPSPCQDPDCTGVIDPFGRRNLPDGTALGLGRCVPRHPGGSSCGRRYTRPLGGGWSPET